MGFQFKVQEAPDNNLPEGSEHIARLEDLQMKTIRWRRDGQEQTADVLEWWWRITESDTEGAVGKRIKGSCNAEMNAGAGNKFRQWTEALLQRELPVGYNVDSDDLVGLEGRIVIAHRADRKDPSRIWEDIAMVKRRDGGDDPWGGGWGSSAQGDVPF